VYFGPGKFLFVRCLYLFAHFWANAYSDHKLTVSLFVMFGSILGILSLNLDRTINDTKESSFINVLKVLLPCMLEL
jgi:hypothetical protein